MTAGGLSRLDAPSELHAAVLAQLERIDPAAGSLQLAQYADALVRGDGRTATDLLVRRFSFAGTAYRLLAVYTLTVLMLERSSTADLVFAERESLQRTIRQQIRCELVSLPPGTTILWLIPATAEQRTAAHVAALIFACSGVTARPWLWPGTPEHGSFRIIGAAEGIILRATAGTGCLGVSGFADLILSALRSIPPVATLLG